MNRLFGTDGVRGIAGSELTGELVYRLGRAAVAALAEGGQSRPGILVGRDTRTSGEFLEAALVAGICSAGGDAILVGVCPTPAVAFLTSDLGTDAGAVISASHNPAEFNGVKFFASTGYKLPDALEDEIEKTVAAEAGPRPVGRDIGRVRADVGAVDRYVRHVIATAEGSLEGLRLVVDCANGAASTVAPVVLSRLGADVHPIHASPDGWNINRGAGATEPWAVAGAVRETGASAGVAFDGDADRAIFADDEGRVIDGDHVLAACALDLSDRGLLEGDVVVTTVMANMGFRLAMERHGIRVEETRVGDRYVLEAMLRSGAVIGGEQSGHVIFLRHATTGDGILTGVQFLTLAHRSGVTVAELASQVQKFPQILLNVPANHRAVKEGAPVWAAVRDAQVALGHSGRVLVRASGTEPVIRVMVEAESADEARRHADAIAAVIRESAGMAAR